MCSSVCVIGFHFSSTYACAIIPCMKPEAVFLISQGGHFRAATLPSPGALDTSGVAWLRSILTVCRDADEQLRMLATATSLPTLEGSPSRNRRRTRGHSRCAPNLASFSASWAQGVNAENAGCKQNQCSLLLTSIRFWSGPDHCRS